MTEFSLAKIITKIEKKLGLDDTPILKKITDKLLIIFKKYYANKLQNSKEQIDNAITKYSEYIEKNEINPETKSTIDNFNTTIDNIKKSVEEVNDKINKVEEINKVDEVNDKINKVEEINKVDEVNDKINKVEEIVKNFKVEVDDLKINVDHIKNFNEYINEVNDFINEINDILEQYKNNYKDKINVELNKIYIIDEGKFNKLFNNKFVNNVNNQIIDKLKTFNTNLGILYINIILKYINKGDNNIINDLINSFNDKIERINEFIDLNQSGGNNLKNNYYYKYFKIKNIF